MIVNSPLSTLFPKLTPDQKKALEHLGLRTIRDMLFYFPSRYSDLSVIKKITDVEAGETATVYGKISGLKTKKGFRSKMPMGEGYIEDLSGKIKITWFHQAYMAKMVSEGSSVKLTGKVTADKNGGVYFANPEIESRGALPIDVHDSLFSSGTNEEQSHQAVYPETKGITSGWIYHAVHRIMQNGALDEIEEYLPDAILKKYNLPTLRTALIWIHAPRKDDDQIAARKRFAFEEIFFIQIKRKLDRLEYEKNKSYEVLVDKTDIEDFMSRFPFTATKGQQDAIDTILEDFQKPHPMTRLLEGDVGSGKTAVAATAAYAIIKNRPNDTNGKRQTFGNLQIAYMAPTEILATQHFESFIKYFRHTGIQIGLITGSGCRKFPSKVMQSRNMRDAGLHSEALAQEWTNISRPQLSKWIENGEVPIVIGTHALIQKSVKFKHLGLVVIDEQHRFGAKQRKTLAQKEGFAPHLLSMTATPIPRTLALTIYGDLDLTLLDEMPAGRKTVITEIISPDKRELAYEEIKKEMRPSSAKATKGRQLYVICPRIDEADPNKEFVVNAKSVVAEAARLKKEVFTDKTFGILHSKMTKDQKEKVMKEFSDGNIDILVATSVVEVGVNVPNATLIIIEGAERFGLAQLHQLRGRVIRSSDQAYCYLFANAKSQKTMDRLKAIKTAKNGFELSEMDLALRGAGVLGAGKQWGISDLGMEAIKNIKMVEAARTESDSLVSKDPELKNYPQIQKVLETKNIEVHFE